MGGGPAFHLFLLLSEASFIEAFSFEEVFPSLYTCVRTCPMFLQAVCALHTWQLPDHLPPLRLGLGCFLACCLYTSPCLIQVEAVGSAAAEAWQGWWGGGLLFSPFGSSLPCMQPLWVYSTRPEVQFFLTASEHAALVLAGC